MKLKLQQEAEQNQLLKQMFKPKINKDYKPSYNTKNH